MRFRSLAPTLVLALLMAGCSRVTPVQANVGANNATSGATGTLGYGKAEDLSGVGSVTGTVLDASNRPVSGATVLVEPGGLRLKTDAQGRFTASNLTVGNYTFTAQAAGLVQALPAGLLVEPNASNTLPAIVMQAGSGASGVTSVTYVLEQTIAQGLEAPGALIRPLSLAARGNSVLALDENPSAGVNTGVVRQYTGTTFDGKFGDYSKWIGLPQMKVGVKAIAIDFTGRTLVLDGKERKIWVFETNGDKKKTYDVSGDGLADISVDPRNGSIYVAHAGGLIRYTAEGEGGTPLGELNGATAVAATGDGAFVVSGTKVVRVDAQGQALFEFGAGGTAGAGEFLAPTDLAFDAKNGNVLVADKGNKAVYVYDGGGVLVGKVGQGQFQSPVSVAADTTGHAYVLDAAKKLIYRYNLAAVR